MHGRTNRESGDTACDKTVTVQSDTLYRVSVSLYVHTTQSDIYYDEAAVSQYIILLMLYIA